MPRFRLSTVVAALVLPFTFIAAGAQPAGEPMEMPSLGTIVGDLVITQPWTRATPPGAVTGAGYLVIGNSGPVADRLLTVSIEIAELGEIHEMSMADERMLMRPLPEGLVIPTGESVILRPGALHLMFVGLSKGIVEGPPVAVTLTFERAGAVEVELMVYPIGSSGPAPIDDMGEMAPMEGMGGMPGMDGGGM